MDKTLMILLILSGLLIGLLAPYATLMITSIVTLAALSTWGSWAFLQGFSQQPEAQTQRIWD